MAVPSNPRPSATDLCPCESGGRLGNCCGPYLDGQAAPTAEALMRSRYTAFALGNEDHLFRTWHPRTRPTPPYGDAATQWVGLQILDVRGGGAEDAAGQVTFVARYVTRSGAAANSPGADGGGTNRTGGWNEPQEMMERSLFERRAGRWFYVGAAE